MEGQEMSSSNKRIVILGAGYAGIFLATNIARYLKGKAGEVILIDRNPYHQLLQEIHLVATGFRTANEVKIPILRLIDGMNIKFIQSTTKQIRPDKNLVILESTEIKYDVLIICLGASTKYFNIKGARENSLPLRSISDASLIYDRVSALIKLNKKQNIVIVGGGATGVSLGGALSDFIKDSKKTDSISITIIEALPTILSGWDEHLVKKVNEVLHKKGIRIMTRSPVTTVENCGSSVYLSDDDDDDNATKIHSSLTIWTAGVKGYDIPIDPEVEKTKDGKIIVNEFCQIDRYPNIFSIGDIAAVKNENQKLYPPLAQIAIREAKYLSKLIPKHFIDGSDVKSLPDEKFEYNIKVQLISLGNDDYVGLFNHYVISGNLAKLVEEFARSTYIKSLKSGGRDIDASLYEDNIFSQLVSGITFARFTFMKWIEKKTQ
jgi:NADH:ubiquinone reductase (H+-translocating)